MTWWTFHCSSRPVACHDRRVGLNTASPAGACLEPVVDFRSKLANLMAMTATEPTAANAAHYTSLIETIDRQGATKLHAKEREQLLSAADALLFDEPESRALLRTAEELIESLETSERWSAESCDQLREHLYGCDAAAGVA